MILSLLVGNLEVTMATRRKVSPIIFGFIELKGFIDLQVELWDQNLGSLPRDRFVLIDIEGEGPYFPTSVPGEIAITDSLPTDVRYSDTLHSNVTALPAPTAGRSTGSMGTMISSTSSTECAVHHRCSMLHDLTTHVLGVFYYFYKIDSI